MTKMYKLVSIKYVSNLNLIIPRETFNNHLCNETTEKLILRTEAPDVNISQPYF